MPPPDCCCANPSGVDGVQLIAPNAQTQIANNQPVAGAAAVPQLALLSGNGTLNQNSNSYALDLGTLLQGEQIKFAIDNAADAPADQLSGSITATSGSGFTLSGGTIPSPIAAGQSYDGLSITPNTGAAGSYSETFTFDPVDGNASGYSSALTPITLTITADVEAPSLSVSESGNAKEGQTLTASATVGDSDDSGASISYQWQNSSDGSSWSSISGATGSTYQLAEADENKLVRVHASVMDKIGQVVSADSAASASVLDNSSLSVQITGNKHAGQTLTATPASSDSDDSGTSVAYQWESSTDGLTWSNVTGATHQTYVAAQADASKYVRVHAAFTDDTGQPLSADSSAVFISLVETAPVVTPTSATTVSHSNPVAATSLFTASDADSDSIVQYDFWDSGQAGGHWLLNGVALPSNQDNFVNAAQLSQVTYRGGAGTETIWERASDGIQFGAWVSVNATDTAPVVTATSANVNVGHGTVAATSLFTASDADTDNIVQYDFWDSGTAGGHWLLNGNALPNVQENFVPASQLSLVTYRGGAGTETIWERASDGIQFGAWVSVNATDTAPVVTPTSATTVSHSNPVAATSLFTASDADSDSIVQYDFWDSGQAGGHWLLNGVALPSNQDNFVNAAQLSQVTYRGGAGTETIWERASDGIQFGAWVSVNATDTAPVVTATSANVNVGHGTVAATSLFTASDADTDNIVQYDFWDSGTAGGHWLLNGNALPNVQENFVPASQLSLVTYRGGNGTETIYERASDGIQFSAWVAINATGTDTAPVVTAISANVTVSHQNPVAATSLFAASDADGDPIVQYDFWDSGSAGGTWLLNGNPLLLGMDNFVSASQLSQVTYRGGAGTETIWERASDGIQYSAWVSVNATDTAPVTTPAHSEVSAVNGKTFAVSSLFTANDADGDPITRYDAWSNGGGGGHWMVGSTVLGTAQDNFLTPTQFAQLTYVAGTSTDTIWVRASDGLRYGAWPTGVTVIDAPVANPTSNSVLGTNQQTFAATSLFTAGDADGDPLTQYDFWDTGSGGGHWVINGTPGMTNTDNFVNAAQLSQVKYQAGNGTDTLWVRVNDGHGFGPWSTPFTVSDPPQVQTVQAGETLEVASPFSGSVTFAGAAGTLKLDNSSTFAGTVAGMTGQDTLDLADMDPMKVQQPTFNGNSSGGTLNVTDGTHSANIALLGNYIASVFVPSSDGNGGTSVVDPPALGGVQPLVTPSHA